MANSGVGKFKIKPTIAPEQAINGAGAKPNAASSMHTQGTGGRRDPDEKNIARFTGNSAAAPDHRVPRAHTPVKKGSEARYTEPSR